MTAEPSGAGPRWRRLGPDERRAAILEAAIRAFGEQPYAEVATAALARDAGVTRGLLHHYFGTKRELYLEVVRTMMTVPPVRAGRLPGGTVRERVEALVDWLLTAMSAHGRTWVAVGTSVDASDPDVVAILGEADDLAARYVLDAVGFTAEIHGDDARETAAAVVRAYGGLVKATAREWIDGGTLDRAQARALLTETLLAVVERLPRITGTDRG